MDFPDFKVSVKASNVFLCYEAYRLLASRIDPAVTGTLLPGRHPEGITTVRFTLNGHSHEMRMNYYGDWFDESAIDQINTILAAEEFTGRIIAYMDGGQGLILFYGDDAFAVQLEKIMPLPYK